ELSISMQLIDVINEFDAITLPEMDKVKLMNRTDRKYWFNVSELVELLHDIKDKYYLLEVEGKRDLPYSTTYYDTPENEMYKNHHRGKLNRYKIRRRSYLVTDSSFLEVKFKSNKGRTIKKRIESEYPSDIFNEKEDKFIAKHTPYAALDLHSVLVNGFRRLMLVSKKLDERCTIDLELHFVTEAGKFSLGELTIVEVKTDGRSKSVIIDALNARRLKPSGFSKYCVGRSIVDASVPNNLFRQKHRAIEKIVNCNLSGGIF
ncbi:MAG: polyphosphate polymerase domain-containing protein, partial [bacterium]